MIYLAALLLMFAADAIFFAGPYVMTLQAHGAETANRILLIAILITNVPGAIAILGLAWLYRDDA